MFPSVTTVLAPWSDFSGVSPQILRAASERGRTVHRACTSHAMGLWAPAVTEDCAGYVLSFRTWLSEAVEDVILAESEFSHPVFQYSGHPDLIVRMRGDSALALVDLKTPLSPAKTWRPQLAAYAELARVNGYDIGRVLAVRLRKSGSRALAGDYTGTLAGDFSTFLACLTAWKYFKGA